MAGTLYVTLRPIEAMQGLGETITGVRLWVEIANPEEIREQTSVIVSIQLKLNKLLDEVSITQRIPVEQMVENRLPLEGELWVPGAVDEIVVESHAVRVVYVPI